MKSGKSRYTVPLVSTLLVAGLALGGCSSDNDEGGVADPGDSTGEGTVLSVDLERFTANALVSSEIVDCELSDGTATQCYEFVTTGLEKATDMIGPFCPESTTTTTADAGLWLDGTTLYEADGDFILDLPNLYGQLYPPAESWILYNDDGSVNVTDTLAACQAAARPDVDPAYYGYCVQCDLDQIEDDLSMTFMIPVTPEAATTSGQLGADAGISLNGFQIAAQAPVEDILSSYTIAAFDDCGGHVNPFDGYHFHAATGVDGCNSAGTDSDGHPELIGYAMDGYGIYGSLESGDDEIDLLDECSGLEDDTYGYHYHAASAELNEHISCFHGKTVSGESDEPPGGGGGGGGPPAG